MHFLFPRIQRHFSYALIKRRKSCRYWIQAERKVKLDCDCKNIPFLKRVYRKWKFLDHKKKAAGLGWESFVATNWWQENWWEKKGLRTPENEFFIVKFLFLIFFRNLCRKSREFMTIQTGWKLLGINVFKFVIVKTFLFLFFSFPSQTWIH